MTTAPAPDATSRSWLGAFIVLAVAVFYAFGLPAINARLPGTAPEPAGVTVDLGNGVSVVTPKGWSADLAKMKPKDTLALRNDTSSLVATAFPWTGTEAELIERTSKLFEGSRRFHLRGTPAPFRTERGLAGHTYSIFGEDVDGRVWVPTLPGGKVGIAVRVRSTPGQGNDALRDTQAVVDSLQYQEVK